MSAAWLPTGGHERYPGITVKLSGTDGNAFAVMGAVTRAMRKAKVPEETRAEFISEATAGDYDHLLRTCMAWVVVN